jgi:hypothetical protein
MSNLINFYSQFKHKKAHNPYVDVHGIELPFRALVNCASGGGKSNLVMNILYQMHNTFHKIIIVSKSPEPLYDYLSDKLKASVEIHYEGAVPEIVKMDKGMNGLIIFDDMVLTKNNKIGEMFIRGRKMGYSSIYISQSFYGTPKIVRQNVSYVWLGHGMGQRDLRMILSEFAMNVSLEQLKQLYSDLTREKMNFMMIDTLRNNVRHNITDIVLEY